MLLSVTFVSAAFIFLWVGLTIFEIIFQTLTLCFYETFYHEIYNLTNPPTCIIPEIANIIISFTMYISAFVLVVFLYYYVFQEALKRARGAKLTTANAEPKIERESLTGSTSNDENDQEAYKRELRLLYGFVALITGTIFFIIARNFYYGLCLYIGCENRAQNDYLVSTLTSIMICSTVVFAPYTYFYRNPLFWKCFLKFVLKVCPKLADYSEQLRQQSAGYYNNNTPQNKTRQINNNNNTNANTVNTKATCLANKQNNNNNNGNACEQNNVQVNKNHEIVELREEMNKETCA
ncbi:uncharacterized protein LOC142342072 [Convolutriloba macropyga]|uniref:uncharacterized protein LOC142342072 n=1 Tax=Convolutriloba macropyga TaxID=536237 RepID=UPI003F51B79F